MASQMQHAVMSITQTIEQIPEVSRTKIDDILTLLRAAQHQVSALPGVGSSTQNESTTLSGDISAGLTPPQSTDQNSALKDNIQRLCELATQSEGTSRYEEAEIILSVLASLLNEVSESCERDGLCLSGKRKAGTAFEGEAITPREIKRLCSLVTAAHCVDVNQGGRVLHSPWSEDFKFPLTQLWTAHQPPLFTDGRIVQKHKNKEIARPTYKTTITIAEKRFQSFGGTQPHAIEYSAKIKAFLEHQQSPIVLVAHIRQSQLLSGFSSLNPAISIGRSLPDDSPIFEYVRQGDVEQLQRLLTRREGTLRDRDSRGTPLLHVSRLDRNQTVAASALTPPSTQSTNRKCANS